VIALRSASFELDHRDRDVLLDEFRPAHDHKIVGRIYDLGGVLLDRPFKVRRLGHVGLNVGKVADALTFYRDLLGFRVSDPMDFRDVVPPSVLQQLDGLPETTGYFTRYGTDHHALVLFPRGVTDILMPTPPEVTLNQITWQVGSLRELHDGLGFLEAGGVEVTRAGRDMPGSNWHLYFPDPEAHVNELYYGIEQIGWAGRAKPTTLYDRRFDEAPELPQISEHEELRRAAARGDDLFAGHVSEELRPMDFDVDGVLLARPFKIVRLGPIGLFSTEVPDVERFYRGTLGLRLTEAFEVEGARCAYLRANTEHHSLALLPLELRERLGLSSHTTLAWLGLQVATYRQLRQAAEFLRGEGVPFVEVPPGLVPGIDFALWIQDPDGHALMLYFGMEQIGWDGRPRPASERRQPGDPWPETIEGLSDTYAGEPFFGPWG
jgi:catechol 2,3-dioxygenase-like lactoylglutathione lyase family enzyme